MSSDGPLINFISHSLSLLTSCSVFFEQTPWAKPPDNGNILRSKGKVYREHLQTGKSNQKLGRRNTSKRKAKH
jgi:hypothetical protein